MAKRNKQVRRRLIEVTLCGRKSDIDWVRRTLCVKTAFKDRIHISDPIDDGEWWVQCILVARDV